MKRRSRSGPTPGTTAVTGAVRSYLDVIAAVVLGVLIFRPTAFRADVSGLIGVSALVIVACSLATASVRMRLWSSVAAGVATGLLFLVNVPVWLSTMTLASLGYAGVAALADWRGIRRDVRTLLAGLGLFVAFACAALVPSAIGAAVVGTTSLLLGDLRYAMPADASIWLAWAALVVLTVVLALDGPREQRPDAAPVRAMLLSLTCVALLARLVWIASIVTMPSQAFWFDGPFLVNALKLRAHVPLYGPLRELNSYTYSPLIDLVHHALLAPLRLDLSIFAHRALILADQVVAAIVLVWATRPYVDRRDVPWLAAALGLTAFASLVAPGIHPDHPMLVCLAVAFALLVSEDRWRRSLWWTCLVAVTPLAAAFKLSGLGIGAGLLLAFLLERRWREVAAMALSCLLALATIPLFDALLGDYATYAIRIQAEGVIEWPRLWQLPSSAFGLSAMAAVVYASWMQRSSLSSPVPDRRVPVRVAVLTAAVSVLSLPAFLKASGRENNLLPLLVGAVVLVIVCGGTHARRAGRHLHPLLPAALALTFVLAARPPAPPLAGSARAAAIEDFRELRRAIADDIADGRRTLTLTDAIAWIDAGRQDVPTDRYASAIELSFARRPESEGLFRHIAEGRYDTVLVGGPQLRTDTPLTRDFNSRLAGLLDADYERVYPAGTSPPEGAVIFRRRPAR